jgi:hypothetical protein
MQALRDRPYDDPVEERLLAEPGESRYQRLSPHIRERAAAVELRDDMISVDLTDG